MCWDPLPAYSQHAMIFRHLLIRGVPCSAACSSGLRCPADCCSQARVVLSPAHSRCAVFRRLLVLGMRWYSATLLAARNAILLDSNTSRRFNFSLILNRLNVHEQEKNKESRIFSPSIATLRTGKDHKRL